MPAERHQRPGAFFESLKPHVGDRLQLEIPSPHHELRYFTTLIGYVMDVSVLVRNPMVNGLPLTIRDNEELIVRGFSGIEAFSFESRVERACIAPFHYLHLAFPQTISVTPIRTEVRVKVNLPVRVRPANGGPVIHAMISNLSNRGIQIESNEDLGQLDENIGVSFHFTIQPNDYDAHIECDSQILHVSFQDNPGGAIAFQYGVKLLNLHSSQAILLQNLIYQKLLESHHNLA